MMAGLGQWTGRPCRLFDDDVDYDDEDAMMELGNML